MKRSITQLLILISWGFLLVSCATGRNALDTENTKLQFSNSPVFGDELTEAVFRGSIEINKHYLSGIFALKKESEENYRLVFMSELGITMLDINFSSEDYQLNYCIDFLEKKALLKLLYHDFLSLTETPDPARLIQMKSKKDKAEFIKFKKDNSRDFYYYESGKLKEIISKAFFNRREIQFLEMEANISNSIKIQHRPVKLKMKLNRIN